MTNVKSTPPTTNSDDDQDFHKGAVEGDRPDDKQNSNPHGDGIGSDGLPDDPIAQAEDKIGANNDETQG